MTINKIKKIQQKLFFPLGRAAFVLLLVLVAVACSSTKKSVPKTDKQEVSKSPTAKGDQLRVTASAYTASHDESDGNPHLTACGDKTSGLMNSIAVSDDLKASGLDCGKQVKIKELDNQVYTVRDYMHSRWTKKIDILMESKSEAYDWGKRKVTLIRMD